MPAVRCLGEGTPVLILTVLLSALCGCSAVASDGPTSGSAALGPPADLPIGSAEPLGLDALAYNSDATGNYEIYVTDTAAKVARQLTSDSRFDSGWPRISPDRRSILFYRAPKGKRDLDVSLYSLWLMNADGSNQRELRPKGTDGWEVQANAQWSPDGKSILMTGGSGKDAQLYVTDATGRSPRAVTQRPGLNFDASWAPDGRTIVFVSCASSTACANKESEVFSIPVEGGAATQLSHNHLGEHDPQYSPDGKRIVWEAETDPNAFGEAHGAWDVFIMNADGSNERKLTDGRDINTMPQWSADGSFIYFGRYAPGRKTTWSIYRMRPDGTDIEEATAGLPGNIGYPSLPARGD